MTRLEKVKNGLKACVEQAKKGLDCDKVNCPYNNPKDRTKSICWTRMNKDALKAIDQALADANDEISQLKQRLSLANEEIKLLLQQIR